MKKILSAFAILALLATASSAFANGRDGGRQGSMSLTATATGSNVKTGLPMNGLLSYKNAMENDVANPKNLDYSLGSATNTFAVARDDTHPATYFDGNGVMQVTTTSDTARRTRGYYDATGWHSAPGWLLEGASTNYVVRTDGTASGSGAWTGWSVIENAAGDDVPTNVDIPELTSIASAKSQRVQYTGQSGDTDKYLLLMSTSTAVGSFVQNELATISLWARTQTGNVNTFRMELSERDAADVSLSSDRVSDMFTLTSSWRRYSFTATITHASCSRLRVLIGHRSLIDAGIAVDFEVYGVQVEKQAYPSSFIPTTTAALTRNAETTNTYTTSGNFPAPSGNNCLSFDGWDDVVTFGDLGNITNVTMRLQTRPTNQQLFTVNNNATGAVTVVAGVLTFGAGLTAGTITVDGVSKTAAQAGALINDLAYHTVSIDLTSVAASDFRLATNATDFGDIFVQSLSTTDHAWAFTEGTGTNLDDSVGANDGTISGATWSKDTYSGTIMLKGRWVGLPREIPQYSEFFDVFFSGVDAIEINSGDKASATLAVNCKSNSKNLITSTLNSTSAWLRYQSHTIIFPFSSVAVGGYKMRLYIDGVLNATNANFMIPAGSLPVAFKLLSSSGPEAMICEEEAQWDRVLTQAEVTQIQNRS